METQAELVTHIRKWVSVDNEIKNLQKMIKEKRKEQKELNGELINVMRDHEIECFDTNDGKIVYTKNKRKAPLNKKHLERALVNYFQNIDKAKETCNYILETREDKEIEKVTRKINK